MRERELGSALCSSIPVGISATLDLKLDGLTWELDRDYLLLQRMASRGAVRLFRPFTLLSRWAVAPELSYACPILARSSNTRWSASIWI